MKINQQLEAIEYYSNNPECVEEFIRETASTDSMEFVDWIMKNKIKKLKLNKLKSNEYNRKNIK